MIFGLRMVRNRALAGMTPPALPRRTLMQYDHHGIRLDSKSDNPWRTEWLIYFDEHWDALSAIYEQSREFVIPSKHAALPERRRV